MSRTMSQTLSWTLSQRLDYYVSTSLSRTLLDFELMYRRLDGSVEHVGVFRLDLPALAERGAVTRRSTERGYVYDVKIVRDPDGSYHLAVRSEGRTPLMSPPMMSPPQISTPA